MSNLKLDYTVEVNEDSTKSVVAPSGERFHVSKDDNGFEYFYIDNPYPNNVLGLFYNRIKDAFLTVQEGYGDAIMIKTLLVKARM